MQWNKRISKRQTTIYEQYLPLEVVVVVFFFYYAWFVNGECNKCIRFYEIRLLIWCSFYMQRQLTRREKDYFMYILIIYSV